MNDAEQPKPKPPPRQMRARLVEFTIQVVTDQPLSELSRLRDVSLVTPAGSMQVLKLLAIRNA